MNCEGTTKKGEKCKNKSKTGNYCHLHQDQNKGYSSSHASSSSSHASQASQPSTHRVVMARADPHPVSIRKPPTMFSSSVKTTPKETSSKQTRNPIATTKDKQGIYHKKDCNAYGDKEICKSTGACTWSESYGCIKGTGVEKVTKAIKRQHAHEVIARAYKRYLRNKTQSARLSKIGKLKLD